MISLILLIFGFVLAVVQAFRGASPPWPVPHLGWLAVALYFLSLILAAAGLK